MEDATRYDLTELSDRAGVTPRTVRYYIQLGLLPSPGAGPGVRYGQGHLDRLRMIRLLQAQHLPLHEIAARLAALDDHALGDALAAAEAPAAPAPNAATAYIHAVLAQSAPPAPLHRSMPRAATPPGTAQAAAPPGALRRENWERINVTADVELHVRRPLSREMNRRIERLLAVARQILADQPSGGDEK